MTTQAGGRIRLVKCPRCRKILPESPEVSMYQCGWCGIVLQAKIRKPETSQAELPSQETDSAAESQQDNVLGQAEDRSSTDDLADSPKVTFSPDSDDDVRCQDDCHDSVKLSHNRGASDGLSGSPDFTSPRSECDDSAKLSHNRGASDGLSGSPDFTSPRSECDDSVKLSHNRGASDVLSGSPDFTSPRSECDDSVKLSHNRGASDGLSGSPDFTSPRSECDDSVKLSHNGGASDGLSCSPDITSLCSERSPLEVQESLGNSPLGRSPKRYRSKSNDHGEWTAGSNSSNELPSLGEISLEAETDTSETSEHVDQHNPRQLHQDFNVEEKNDGESQSIWPESDNFVDEVQNLPEGEEQENALPERVEDNYVLAENDATNQTSSTNQNGESSGEIRPVGPDSPSGMISHENNMVSSSAELVDDGFKGRSSITERSMALNPGDSIHAPRSPSKGSLVSFYLTSEDEQQDHSPREIAHNFQRFNSIDTMGSSHHGDFSSELNFRSGSTAYYPTSRNYYAYDGSESSCDGIDDQFHEHVSRPSRKDNDIEELRRDGLSGKNMVNNEAEGNYWASSPSHRAMHRPWSLGKSTEANRYTGRNRMRPTAQEDVSRLPFPLRDHIAGQRPGTSSDHRQNLPPPHQAFNSSDKSSYSDPEKIDLLRTVYHLTDQLQRMQFPKVMPPNRRFPEDGNFPPFSYNPLASERDMYADVSYVAGRYNRRHDRAKVCGERYNDPRMAFSGEAAHFRHQASCSCLHCCPQDWHYSAQLPSCSMHRKNGHRLIHNDSSSSLSPNRYASSEPSSWGCETKSDNQRLAEIKRLQLREKYQTAKRHLRPIAGGAPVIACYHCSELLQLPVDFLLFKKRYHKLMCNACRKVLKFSFLKGTTHLVPYVPDASAPPPSEAGDCKEASGRRNLVPAPRSSSCQHVESVSCSDDLGQSFCRSCSTEGEASAVLPPLDQVKRDSYNRKMPSGSSYEPVEDRKLKGILKVGRRQNDGSLLESVESVGPSSRTRNWGNATTSISEIEELPPLANSPLHRLMGYSTPSKVFKR